MSNIDKTVRYLIAVISLSGAKYTDIQDKLFKTTFMIKQPGLSFMTHLRAQNHVNKDFAVP